MTLTGERGIGKNRHCLGEFWSAGGSIVFHEVKVQKPGPCAPGVRKPARLVRGSTSDLFLSNERDVAWTPSAKGWVAQLMLTVLFGAPLLLFGFLSVRNARRRPSRESGNKRARGTTA